MSKLLGVPGLLAACAMVVVVSLLGLALVVFRLGSDIDGLLLLMICLMMGGIFTLMILAIAKESGLLPIRRRRALSQEAPAANLAATQSSETSGEGKS